MTTPQAPLSEKDFIHEGYKKDPFPAWLWFILLIFFIALLWGGSSWYNDKLDFLLRNNPFLQVTNRQISLFLWQNPEYMRPNVQDKTGYLPAFQADGVTINLADVNQYVSAPPEVLFRYHTWDRLVKSEFTPRPIPIEQFQRFLKEVPEWRPRYWPEATDEYETTVEHLANISFQDLAVLSAEQLPLDVRIAFQGWQNYFFEGDAINALQISKKLMRDFLRGHPDYARNYWINLVKDATPKYLLSVDLGSGDEMLAADEVAPFLRVALYNYVQTQPSSVPSHDETTPASKKVRKTQ